MSFCNKVPLMTGINSSELGFAILMFFDKLTPGGLMGGITENGMIELYQMMAKMGNEDPSKVPQLVEAIKKIYGKDFSNKMEYTKIHSEFNADAVYYYYYY